MKDENIQAQQCAQGIQLMMQGMAMVFGSVAESMGSVKPSAAPTAVDEARVPKPAPAAPKAETTNAIKDKAAESAKPAKAEEPAKPENAPAADSNTGKPITRPDVERAMGAKIMELAQSGRGPEAVGQLFPLFHNAECISDLTVDDYPGFLAELAKL